MTLGQTNEAVGGNEAASRSERVAEGRLGVQGFGAGVDHAVADARSVGPVRHQPPAHELERARAVVGDHQHGLGGGDIVARRERSGWLAQLEPGGQGLRWAGQGIATAHRCVARITIRVGLAGPVVARRAGPGAHWRRC